MACEETLLIACKTLEDELALVLKDVPRPPKIEWVKSGLHNTPEKLHDELQRLLDTATADVARVLLAFGNCGNAVHHLRTGGFELVVPRADDCISLLLGSDEHREKVAEQYAGIYLTAGWMRGERNLVVEYNHMLERYGRKVTEQAIRAAYGNYRSLCLLDTGAYDIDELAAHAQEVSAFLGLKRVVVSATTSYLAELVTGPWASDRFVTVPPNSEVNPREFY